MTAVGSSDPAGPGIDEILARAAEIDGVLAAAIVEASSGMLLAGLQVGDASDPVLSAPDPGVIAAGAADVVLVLSDLISRLGQDDDLEDVMVTTTGCFHVVRLLRDVLPEPVALIVTLDRTEANLAMARRELLELGVRFDA